MEKEQQSAIKEQLRRNKKQLYLTVIVLAIIGILIISVKSCKSTDPLVENAVDMKQPEMDPDMEQLIFRIQNCSRLYTTEYQVHKIITHEDQKRLSLMGIKMDIPFTDRRIAVPMDATLKAYVDLGAFSQDNIQTDGERILVTLPDPHIEVTSTVIDHENTKSHVSITRDSYSAKEQEALHRQGLNSIAENILNSDILEHAKLSATRTLVPIITRMGYKEENIRIAFSKEAYDAADLSRLVDGNVFNVKSKKE